MEQEKQEQIVKGLRNLADQIELHGLRSAELTMCFETIEIISSSEWKEHRSGPRSQIILSLDWAHIEPVNRGIGEESRWTGIPKE